MAMIRFQEIEPPEPPTEPVEYLYRYEDRTYSLGLNQFDDPLPGYTLKVELQEYRIIKRTPQGAWIVYGSWSMHTPKRFVLLSARKRFACETKEEALESFKARKRKQIKILKAQLKRAEMALSSADRDTETADILPMVVM
jgi:hypothetical protein